MGKELQYHCLVIPTVQPLYCVEYLLMLLPSDGPVELRNSCVGKPSRSAWSRRNTQFRAWLTQRNCFPVSPAPWGGVELSRVPISGVFGRKITPPGSNGILRVNDCDCCLSVIGNTVSIIALETSNFFQAWAWRHPPHGPLVNTVHPGPRTLWLAQVHIPSCIYPQILYIR